VTSPRISVIICAYTEKRWDQTLAAVESVRLQSRESLEIILVVDHNRALRDRFAGALPDVILLENAEAQGLSGARNTGIAIARGDVIAFLDDDAIAEPDWLKFLADCYEDPAVAGVGGLTMPLWETERPPWFPEEFDWVIGCAYRGMPRSRMPVRNILGGNASYRREVFRLVGGFSTTMGRSSDKRPMGCEETELCIRITQRRPDMVILFENRAMISHWIPAARCRLSYFTSRCYAEGLSKAFVAASVGAQDALSSERRYATRTLPTGIARGLAATINGDRWGLARAGVIIIGLAVATAGYGVGSLRGRVPRNIAVRSA
jgi:glucosyl-dolichyl phosphate glucuronosyltransferase